MGKNKKKSFTSKPPQNSQSSSTNSEILSTLDDFTSKDNWDNFFSIRGPDDSFEWYAEWPHLKPPLLSLLPSPHHSHILVPACGNSRLSEHLYDAGYHHLTNLDFSKVVISNMLRRNIRDRPNMKWRLMDITSMQFSDGEFDIVLDKGGLDALMEPEFGPKLGNQYLSEVKRVLKPGGKFICLTLAESHVLGLLFSKFRFGWPMTIQCIPQKPSSSLNTFMVVAVKGDSSTVGLIISSFDSSSISCNREQARGLCAALEAENKVRKEHLDGADIVYSLEDLKLGAKGDLKKLKSGRRVQLVLGGEGDSLFRYRAVILDAQDQSLPFSYHCGIFLVPKTRAHEWLFSSEEGQWIVVESSNAARLIMVLLDSSHINAGLEDIQKDFSPLVKPLAPETNDSDAQIPFMMAGDGIKHRNIVHQATSKLTGPITVEDVIYENVDDHLASISPSEEPVFRRLVFQRTEGLVQSEGLLISRTSRVHDDVERKKTDSNVKSKKKEKQNKKQSQPSHSNELSNKVEVDHTFMVGAYHRGIVAGFTLTLSYLDRVSSGGGKIQTLVIGLGAGLLPKFLHSCFEFLFLEVVELDPVVCRLAKEHFSFFEDERLKVHVGDGIQFLRNFEKTNLHKVVDTVGLEETIQGTDCTSLNGSHATRKLDIIIIDVDSSDSSSGLSCPAADFVEDSFFATVKDVLSEQGLFIINLVSRSPSIKEMIISRMKKVFSQLFCLQLEEDVNEVIFALNSATSIEEEHIAETAIQLEKFLNLDKPERSQSIVNAAKRIKCLK